MKKSLTGLGILLLLMVGWSQIASRQTAGSRSQPHSEEDNKQKTEPHHILVEVGILEAEVLAHIPSPNRGIIAELADDGSRVQTGDMLARLDEEEFENNIETLKETLEQDQESLDEEQQELVVITNQYEAVSRLEKAELADAELRLRKARVPLTPDEIRLHEIDLELARLNVEEAVEKLKRQQELVERNYAPDSSLGKLERALEAAQTQLRETRTRFDLAKAPMPKEEQLTLQSEVRKASQTVSRSKKIYDQAVKIQRLKIEELEMRIQRRKSTLKRFEKDLEAATVLAPTQGIFLLIRDFSWGSRTFEPLAVGNRIYGGDLLGTVVDPEDLYLRLMVHESDVDRVYPGQNADIHLTAFPGKTFAATVRSVTALGQDRDDLSPLHRQVPPANQALFLAILDMDLPDNLPAMPGMTATVHLLPEKGP